MPYISDIGIVRNFTKDEYNTTSAMPSLQLLEAGYFPGFDRAPPGVGSAVSAFRRVHHNFLIANYNSEVTVTLDDASSRFLTYDNYMVYGNAAGESCHNAQWIYGVGNLYAYAAEGNLLASEGPSPEGIRTFYYNSTFLDYRDSDWCKTYDPGGLKLPQFWGNKVHSPNGTATVKSCHGGNNTQFGPMPDSQATQLATAILAPFPRGWHPS